MTVWVKRLIVANVIVFFLQNMSPGLTNALVFDPRHALVQPWTFVTYLFLHASFSHILWNMVALYFFGPRVEDRLGANHFLTMYFIAGVVGALLTMVFAPNSAVVGASGAICGVSLAFAWFWPTAQIYIWGILPVQAWFLVVIYAAYSIFSGFNGSRSGVADFAHLGGYAGAAVYLWYLGALRGSRSFKKKTVTKVPVETLSKYKQVDLGSIHEVNRDEVNRILDKISAKGLNSLTPQERLFLSNFVPPDDRVPPPT